MLDHIRGLKLRCLRPQLDSSRHDGPFPQSCVAFGAGPSFSLTGTCLHHISSQGRSLSHSVFANCERGRLTIVKQAPAKLCFFDLLANRSLWVQVCHRALALSLWSHYCASECKRAHMNRSLASFALRADCANLCFRGQRSRSGAS